MIDARELRIGNWVKFHNFLEKERYILVTPRFFSSLAGGRSFEEQANDTVLNEYWQPIPLTAEILEKCGFDCDMMLHWLGYSINGTVSYISLTCGDYTWLYDNQLSNIDKYPRRQIKTVHQLQNLVYALTGKELEITI